MFMEDSYAYQKIQGIVLQFLQHLFQFVETHGIPQQDWVSGFQINYRSPLNKCSLVEEKDPGVDLLQKINHCYC